MADLLSKLNLLIKSRLGEVLPELPTRGSPTRPADELDRDLIDLRERVQAAVDYEARLTQMAQQLEADVQRLDLEADQAVAAGRDDVARRATEAMNKAEQRLRATRADLLAHQQVTEDLIKRVNALGAAAADVHHSEHKAEVKPASPAVQASAMDMPSEQNPAPTRTENANDDDDLAKRRQRLARP